MCGRTSLFPAQPELEARFDATVAADAEYRPRYNIAPGADFEVISHETPSTIDQYRWGFVPRWMGEVEEGFINARSETAAGKPAFRDAWERRPCLVLSSGFYEWQPRDRGPNRPYRIYREDDTAFAMAGLWTGDSIGDNPGGRTVTILTTEPNDLLEPIHDRMPVVLPKDAEWTWLTGDVGEREALCRPYPEDDLAAYEVSTRVNDPNHDDARVIEPRSDDQSNLEEFV